MHPCSAHPPRRCSAPPCHLPACSGNVCMIVAGLVVLVKNSYKHHARPHTGPSLSGLSCGHSLVPTRPSLSHLLVSPTCRASLQSLSHPLVPLSLPHLSHPQFIPCFACSLSLPSFALLYQSLSSTPPVSLFHACQSLPLSCAGPSLSLRPLLRPLSCAHQAISLSSTGLTYSSCISASPSLTHWSLSLGLLMAKSREIL